MFDAAVMKRRESSETQAKTHGLYDWDDPNFDKSRDVMHQPGTKQYLGPTHEGQTAAGLPNVFPRESVIRHR